MPTNHGKQKRLEKQKKKRDLARKRAKPHQALAMPGTAAIIKMAAQLPFGPCFVSAGWDVIDEAQPKLVTVVITRAAPDGSLIPAIALVDRTCLGVKNGFVAKPVHRTELERWLEPIAFAHDGIVPVEPLVAQSIVFHGIDYARSLGFEPQRDFPEPLFGPRPEALLDTPLARPTRPIYVSGPDDNVKRVLARLDLAVGPGNYGMIAAHALSGDPLLLDDEDDEDEDEVEGSP
jgi:hypothetical protein